MELVLPLPVSKNDAYVEQAVAKKADIIAAVEKLMANEKGAWTGVKRAMKVIRRRSPEYLAYLERLRLVLAGQDVQVIEGDVRLHAVAFFPDRRWDMVGVDEVLLDALEGHCYGNDRQVKDFRLQWALDKRDPRIVVTVEPLEQADLFAGAPALNLEF